MAGKVSVNLDLTAASEDEDQESVIALVSIDTGTAELTWAELVNLQDDIGAALDAYDARRG